MSGLASVGRAAAAISTVWEIGLVWRIDMRIAASPHSVYAHRLAVRE